MAIYQKFAAPLFMILFLAVAFIFPFALAEPEYIITKVTFRVKEPGKNRLPAVAPGAFISVKPLQNSEFQAATYSFDKGEHRTSLDRPEPSLDDAWKPIPADKMVSLIPFHVNKEWFVYLRSPIPQRLRDVDFLPDYKMDMDIVTKKELMEFVNGQLRPYQVVFPQGQPKPSV